MWEGGTEECAREVLGSPVITVVVTPLVWTLGLESVHNASRWLGHMSGRAGMHCIPVEVWGLIHESTIFKAHQVLCHVVIRAATIQE